MNCYNPSSGHFKDCVMALQMSEESDSFYIIEEGTVSVEAAFVDIPLAQRAVSFPVNVASPNNSWYQLPPSQFTLPPKNGAI